MEMKKLTLPLLLAAIIPSAGAQTLHESISVEGKYVPDIIRLDRLYAFPESKPLTLETTPMVYDWKGVTAAFDPTLMAMPVTGWRVNRTNTRHAGYLQADLGSWLNSNLSAGYRFLNTPASTAGAWLQFNSTSLWKPDFPVADPDRQMFRYDGTIGVYGGHSFKDSGLLDAALSWHTGYFDYYSWLPLSGQKAPTQTLNDMALKVGWRSEEHKGSLTWYASASARYFGFRDLYLPGTEGGVKPARETRLSIAGGLAMPWESGSTLGLDAGVDALLYSKQDDIVNGSHTLTAPENYSQVELTPYYRFSRGLLNVKVGAKVDLTFHAGLPGNRYSVFHIAPDITLDYQSGSIGFYLNVLGGSQLQTLASLHEQYYYMMPTLSNTRPVYSPIDAALGVTFGPFSGFSAGVEFGYKVANRVPLGGWYGWMMFDSPSPWESNLSPLYGFDTEGLTVKGISIGLDLAYTTGKLLTVKASGHYQPQKEGRGYFNGFDRPRWILDAAAVVNPWSTLKVSVGYSYRGVRNIYTRLEQSEPVISIDGSGYKTLIGAMRLPDLTMLNAGASYDITPTFGVRIEALNLLNRHTPRLPGLPNEGMSITGGFSLLF